MTRSLLARPWYRNAVAGDRPLFANFAVTLPTSWKTSVSFNAPVTGMYELAAREAADEETCFSVTADDSKAISRCDPAGSGFHWISIPIELRAGSHKLALTFDPAAGITPLPNIVLDGIAIEPRHNPFQMPETDRKKIVIYSVQWSTVGTALRPLWFPAGRYHAGWFATDGTFVAAKTSIDGRTSEGVSAIHKSGLHSVGAPPLGATLFVLIEVGTPTAPRQQSIGEKRSATTWDVDVAKTGTVRATVLNDKWWSLDGAGSHFDGYDCDLVDTCFEAVPPGRYVLHHRWPFAVTFGIFASLAVLLLAALPCIVTARFRHSGSGR